MDMILNNFFKTIQNLYSSHFKITYLSLDFSKNNIFGGQTLIKVKQVIYEQKRKKKTKLYMLFT
jgi:hypothetical protein